MSIFILKLFTAEGPMGRSIEGMTMENISSKTSQPVLPTNWKNAAFIMIGSIGTCVIVGIIYFIKSM
jgi:hypothetical protein